MLAEKTATVPQMMAYRPGEFFLRGHSARPLYITAAGMPAKEAADLVRHMTGRFRLPDALRRADALARAGQSPGTDHPAHAPH